MLELRSITKRFPGVTALDDVSIEFHANELHALVGENGAGKSTLIKIVTGIYRPDTGDVVYDGVPITFRSVGESRRRGIGIVHQEIQVVPDASVAENVMLDTMSAVSRRGIVDWRRLNAAAAVVMERVGLNVPPTVKIGRLSVAHKQLSQIARALASDARVLLLDEPTSSLTEHEAERLFGILRSLKDAGVAVIFVSHKLNEVYELCDCVSVLRDGRYVGTHRTDELPHGELVEMMIGRAVETEDFGTPDVRRDTEVLRVTHLKRHGKVNDVSFSLYEGEILGLYGLVGAGRTELARVLVGADARDGGEILLRGRKVTARSVSESLYDYGIGYVTENRKEEGLVLEASVGMNIGITVWERLVHRISRLIRAREERTVTTHAVEQLDIRITGVDQETQTLSGGNQQKVSISKWLVAGCEVLIMDEPTVGVDIGAKAQIHRMIWQLAAEERKSIILISSEMPELITLASRILVFRDQRVVHETPEIRERRLSYEQISVEIGAYLN